MITLIIKLIIYYLIFILNEGVKVEKVDNVENDIRRAKITVKKNNGVCEAFSYEKLLKSLVMVDAPYFESERIVSTVVENLYDGISTKEIKKIVYECLEQILSKNYFKSTFFKR